MTQKKKLHLSNLSTDGERMQRSLLSRKELKKPFDRKGYNDR